MRCTLSGWTLIKGWHRTAQCWVQGAFVPSCMSSHGPCGIIDIIGSVVAALSAVAVVVTIITATTAKKAATKAFRL